MPLWYIQVENRYSKPIFLFNKSYKKKVFHKMIKLGNFCFINLNS